MKNQEEQRRDKKKATSGSSTLRSGNLMGVSRNKSRCVTEATATTI